MFSLRSFARVLPRATFKASPIIARSSQRFITASKPSILSRTTAYKSFSTTRVWREPAGTNDAELSLKLASEYGLEDESKVPQVVSDYLADSQFQVEDIPGSENVILTKQMGNETIKIEFSIADMLSGEQEAFDDDDAMLDEEDIDGSVKRSNQDGTPEEVEPVDLDEAAYPVHLKITIDKGAAGATNIVARAEDGLISIDYVHFYPNGKLTHPSTTAEAQQADNLYGGPPFTNLDGELQGMYETYLEERGIDARLAQFLPAFIDYKEQREYVKWLQDLKSFIDA